jgi:hypothetical protein
MAVKWKELYITLLMQIKCDSRKPLLVGVSDVFETLLRQNAVNYTRVNAVQQIDYTSDKWYKIVCQELHTLTPGEAQLCYYDDMYVVSEIGWVIPAFGGTLLEKAKKAEAAMGEIVGKDELFYSNNRPVGEWTSDRQLVYCNAGVYYQLVDFKRSHMLDLVKRVRERSNMVKALHATVVLPPTTSAYLTTLPREDDMPPLEDGEVEILEIPPPPPATIPIPVLSAPLKQRALYNGEGEFVAMLDVQKIKSKGQQEEVTIISKEPRVIDTTHVHGGIRVYIRNYGGEKASEVDVEPGSRVSYRNSLYHKIEEDVVLKVIDAETGEVPKCVCKKHVWVFKDYRDSITLPSCKGRYCGQMAPLPVCIEYYKEGKLLQRLPLQISAHKEARGKSRYKTMNGAYGSCVALGQVMKLEMQEAKQVDLITPEGRLMIPCLAHQSCLKWFESKPGTIQVEIVCVGCVEEAIPVSLRSIFKTGHIERSKVFWVTPEKDRAVAQRMATLITNMGAGPYWEMTIKASTKEVQTIRRAFALGNSFECMREENGSTQVFYSKKNMAVQEAYKISKVFDLLLKTVSELYVTNKLDFKMT